MTRTLATSDEISEWMTNQLRKFSGCTTFSVGAPYRLKDLDTEGCNWSDSLVVSTDGAAFAVYRAHLTAIVAQAREKFNLE